MNPTPRPTRSEQREEARAKAKALREQTKKRDRRKGILIKSGIAVGIIAAFAIIATVVVSGINSGGANASKPGNLTADFGLKIGANAEAFTSTYTPTAAPSASSSATPTKPVEIVVYLDYDCPYCAMFETSNNQQIKGWLDSGYATLEVRPLSFLDGRDTPNEYSSRAAAVALAVATYDPNNFFAVTSQFFKTQPGSGVPGPENSELINTLRTLGVKNIDQIEAAVNDKRYQKWVLANTTSTFKANPDLAQFGTPYILVNGTHYTGAIDNAAAFAQFVTGLAGK